MKHFATHAAKQAYIQAQATFLEGIAKHCDYAITLQTNLRTYAVAESTKRARLAATERALTKFRLRMNQLLTGNGWRRKAAYVPVFVASIEGMGDKDKTLHIHAALGNTGHIATEQTRVLLEQGLRHIWLRTDVSTEQGGLWVAADDVKVVLIDRAADRAWMGYMGKEATNKGNWDVIDWTNAQGITGLNT
ncbi:MAG: hypothetical protein EBS75_11575 [Betaproteobacteria bacterium]|jgi:hypothetical protein|nr:hypothetical protein [Betaproteobacteria bacterium]